MLFLRVLRLAAAAGDRHDEADENNEGRR